MRVKLEKRQNLPKITYCYHDLPYSQDPKSSHDDGSKPSSDDGKKHINTVNAAGTNEVNAVGGKTSIELPFDPNMPTLEDYRDDED
ncbi:hypothetical protein Tco_0501434, partial [Tanacetum coccineum]